MLLRGNNYNDSVAKGNQYCVWGITICEQASLFFLSNFIVDVSELSLPGENKSIFNKKCFVSTEVAQFLEAASFYCAERNHWPWM